MNGAAFLAYTEQLLAPSLRKGDVVILDTPTCPQSRRRQRWKSICLNTLAARSSENAFAKLKALLRNAAERTIPDLWQTTGRLLDVFEPAECADSFQAAGYEPT